MLKGVPELVKSFGPMHRGQDDDHFWEWWEFVIFDGLRWHSFHLDGSLGIKLQMNFDSEKRKDGPDLGRVIVEEFTKAVADWKAREVKGKGSSASESAARA